MRRPGLGELGVGIGDSIGIVLRNDFAFFEASYAAQRLGAYSVPVNWHGKTQEIAYVLNDCGAKAVVAHVDLLPEVVPAMPSGVPLFVVPTPPEIAAAYRITDERCRPSADALQWGDLATCFPPVVGAAGRGISSMIYTSGTTGNPKGARRLDIGADPAQLRTFLMDEVFGIAPDRVVRAVITGPLYHSAPNAYGLYAVRMGGLAVLQPRFDAEELLRLRAIPHHAPSHGAHYVCPAAASAGGGQTEVRPFIARMGDTRHRTLPCRGKGGNDRMAGAGHLRILWSD